MAKSLKAQIIDQVAHMGVAILAMTPILIHPAFYTGALTGFIMGMIREVTQRGEPVTLKSILSVFDGDPTGSMLDLTFWTIGGIIAGAAI